MISLFLQIPVLSLSALILFPVLFFAVVDQLKPPGFLCDVIPPHLFKEVFDVVGPTLLVFIH